MPRIARSFPLKGGLEGIDLRLGNVEELTLGLSELKGELMLG